MKRTAFLLLAVGLWAGCKSDRQPEGQDQPWQPKIAGPVPELTAINFSREDPALRYQATISYPGIQGDQTFNALMQESMKGAIDRFEEFIKDFEGDGRTLDSRYEVVQLSDTVVSIKQVYEWAVPGTSILLYEVQGINYDPAAKRSIPLSAFFPAGKDYRPALRKLLHAKIKKLHQVEVEVRDDDLAAFAIGGDFLEFYKVLYPDLMEPEPKAFRLDWGELKKIRR